MTDDSTTPTKAPDGIGMSPSITKLAAAMAKAQPKIAPAKKGALNPHFKSRYADLASTWDACRGALAEHGLSVLQPVTADGRSVTIRSVLLHESGEWIESALTLTAQKDTPQAIGSAITYGRRYGLQALLGIPAEDDDGNAASEANGNGRPEPTPEQKRANAEAIDKAVQWLDDVASSPHADSLAEAVRMISEMPEAVKGHERVKESYRVAKAAVDAIDAPAEATG